MPLDEGSIGHGPSEGASDSSAAEEIGQAEEHLANDRVNSWPFINNLNGLQKLRTFLIQEAVPIPTDLSFGGLNSLRYDQLGRPPSREEWSKLEELTPVLFGLLPDRLRRKFIATGIPSWMTSTTIVIGGIAVVALIGAVLSLQYEWSWLGTKAGAGVNAFPFYSIWLVCLGAIGSIAFIGMNALSVQDDITFDLSNRRLMVLRIALGSLFGLVLTLPFGFGDFVNFCLSLNGATPSSAPTAADASHVTKQATMLLLPFILGFSNSLVIMLLNRMVNAVEAFFGQGASSASRTASVAAEAGAAVAAAHAAARGGKG